MILISLIILLSILSYIIWTKNDAYYQYYQYYLILYGQENDTYGQKNIILSKKIHIWTKT